MKTIFIPLAIMILFSLSFTGILYSEMNDKTDRLSREQSSVFSPGYINAAKQRTESIVNQVNGNKKRFNENIQDNLTEDIGKDVTKASQDMITPELKKKTGGSGENARTLTEEPGALIIDSTQYNVNIGSGTNKSYSAEGQLLSEVINGTRHIYVGFANAGTRTIQEAVSIAIEGDMVLVRGGTYAGYTTVKNGVKLYGGYNDLGERDIVRSKTVISDGGFYASSIDKPTEINGFTIQNPYGSTIGTYRPNYYGVYTWNSSDQLKIINNTIISGYIGIRTVNSKAVIYSNNIYGASWSAIYTSSSSLTVTNNFIHNTTFGITETYRSSSMFQNNVVWSNHTNFIIHGSSTSIIDRNTIYAGTDGIRYHNSTPIVTNNVFVGTQTALRIMDDVYQGWGTSSIIATGNIFYNNTNIGINSSLLSQGSNLGNLFTNPGLINPTQGIYTPSLIDKGYSTKNIAVDYNKVIIGSSFGQNVAKAVSENVGLGTTKDGKNVLRDNNLNSFNISLYASLASDYIKGANSKSLGNVFKSLLMGKGSLVLEETGNAEHALLLSDNTQEFALAIPTGVLKEGSEWGNVVLILTNILNNPNEDQKLLIDVAKGIMKIEDGSGSPELKKAQDDLLQMVASVLIAQAIPDLLKEGDVANIKSIFSQLNDTKSGIMLAYQESIKPYYEEIAKDLAKNISALQLKSIISNSITKDELEKLPRNEIDKMLEKIRKIEKKSFEENYILQQESKYRKAYIEPNKNMLEEKMKMMMMGFTQRLSKILETTKNR